LALKTKDLPPAAFALQYMLRYLRLDGTAIPEDSDDVVAALQELASGHPPGHMAQWVRTIQSRYVDTHVPAPYRPGADVLEVWAQHGAVLHGAGAAWQQVLQKPTDRVVLPGDHESVIGREHASRLARTVNDWIAGVLTPA
jgi:hypothetical protein